MAEVKIEGPVRIIKNTDTGTTHLVPEDKVQEIGDTLRINPRDLREKLGVYPEFNTGDVLVFTEQGARATPKEGMDLRVYEVSARLRAFPEKHAGYTKLTLRNDSPAPANVNAGGFFTVQKGASAVNFIVDSPVALDTRHRIGRVGMVKGFVDDASTLTYGTDFPAKLRLEPGASANFRMPYSDARDTQLMQLVGGDNAGNSTKLDNYRKYFEDYLPQEMQKRAEVYVRQQLQFFVPPGTPPEVEKARVAAVAKDIVRVTLNTPEDKVNLVRPHPQRGTWDREVIGLLHKARKEILFLVEPIYYPLPDKKGSALPGRNADKDMQAALEQFRQGDAPDGAGTGKAEVSAQASLPRAQTPGEVTR